MSAELIKKLKYKPQHTRKYYVNCDEVTEDPNSLELNTLFQYKDDTHVIQATVKKYLNLPEFNNEIVIKMAKSNKTIAKEYDIGKTIQYIPGFVRFICMFQCYDNNSADRLPRQICRSPVKNDETKKLVILMPYYQLGSIKNYPWKVEETRILKSLLKQIVASTYTAFKTKGFLHSDLHLDNILITESADSMIIYALDIMISTEGYKIVITDFELSFVGIENTLDNRKFFWDDLLNMFSRLYELNTISPTNLESTLAFLSYARSENSPIHKAMELFRLIDDLKFRELDTTRITLKYNPDIY